VKVDVIFFAPFAIPPPLPACPSHLLPGVSALLRAQASAARPAHSPRPRPANRAYWLAIVVLLMLLASAAVLLWWHTPLGLGSVVSGTSTLQASAGEQPLAIMQSLRIKWALRSSQEHRLPS